MRNRNRFPRAIIAALLAVMICPAVSRADSPLRVSVAHPVFPVVQGISQKIEIELSSPSLKAGEEHRLHISSGSGMGILQLPGGPATKGEVRCRAGERVSIQYRWAGAVPTERPVAEKITVSAPDIGATEIVEFSIGVDLRVTEIRVPLRAESNKRGDIGLVVQDTLHPNADLAAMLQNLGIAPELRISLQRDGSDTPVTPVEDAFVARFLGKKTAPQKEVAFPPEYTRGRLAKAPGGEKYEWTNADGGPPGFVAPTAGSYHIKASFKPGTGGVAVRETVSSAFDVSGETSPGSDIPGYMGSTVRIVATYRPEAIPQLTQDIHTALQQGGSAQAASFLGAAMKKTGASSPSHTLGKYVETLAETQMNVDELSPYIQSFLRGYGGYGVLILSRSGVASWKAIMPDNTALVPAPKNLGENASAQARLYVGDRYVVIPFELGKNFTLNIAGSNKGGTSLWKVMPEGVNRKTYPQGDWEKEVTVYAGQVQPPAK